MGGAVARVADDATAFAERSMPFVLNAVTGWHDAAAGSAHREWARDVVDAAADATTGRAYVNFLGDTDAARSSYGERDLRPPGRAQERLRPEQRVPAQPEHRAASRRRMTLPACGIGLRPTAAGRAGGRPRTRDRGGPSCIPEAPTRAPGSRACVKTPEPLVTSWVRPAVVLSVVPRNQRDLSELRAPSKRLTA